MHARLQSHLAQPLPLGQDNLLGGAGAWWCLAVRTATDTSTDTSTDTRARVVDYYTTTLYYYSTILLYDYTYILLYYYTIKITYYSNSILLYC